MTSEARTATGRGDGASGVEDGGEAAVGDLVGGFAASFGHDPAGVWAAPGRINVIGEHTDYNDGFALPLALPQRVTIAAAARDDGWLLLRSRRHPDRPAQLHLADLAPGVADGWEGYVAGVAWALQAAGHRVGGAEMVIDADLPAGSGLASSAALECAVGVALRDLWVLDIPPDAMATLAQRAENDFVGMPCGVMDQMASMRCMAGHALFLDCADLSTRQVPLAMEASGLRLAVIDTRAPHRHVDSEYAARRRSCEHAAATLGLRTLRELDHSGLESALTRLDAESGRRVRHVVTENARVLEAIRLLGTYGSDSGTAISDGPSDSHGLDRDEITAVGRLLTQSHVSLRDDYEVSCPELDVAVEAALEAGAAGARMTGGGFGGCAIALIDASAADTVAGAVHEAYQARDFPAPQIFTAVPSSGARRIR